MSCLKALAILLSLSIGAAKASESDKLCLYLGSIANEATKKDMERAKDPARDVDSKMKEIMELTAFIQKLDPAVRDAIAQRLTFEQFQSKMAAQNIKVTPYYKSLYIGRYIRNYCGEGTDESKFTIVNGKITDSKRTVTFSQQFDPTRDPYYEQMKSNESPVGR